MEYKIKLGPINSLEIGLLHHMGKWWCDIAVFRGDTNRFYFNCTKASFVRAQRVQAKLIG